MTLSFIVPGVPRPKERPRVGKHGNVYTPKATKAYEQEVWILARDAGASQDCFKGKFLSVEIDAAMGPEIKDLIHIDIDNIIKVVCDGLSPAFNDAYITHLVATKNITKTQYVTVRVSD